MSDVSAALPEALSLAAEPESLALPDPSAALRLQVLRPDGRPATLARLVLYDEVGVMVAEGEVDAEGSWAHSGLARGATVRVRGVTAGIEEFKLERGRGVHQLRLPDGETVRGTVLVDGEPPGRRFVVELSSEALDHPPWDDAWRLPAPFTLPNEARLAVHAGIPTDAEGRFELSSVPRGAQLEFRAPGAFRLDPSRSARQPMRVEAGAHDITLAIESPPRLSGRVVDASGRAVPQAVVELSASPDLAWIGESGKLSPPERRSPEPFLLELDAEARFSFPIADHAALGRPSWRMVGQEVDLIARAPDNSWVDATVTLADLTRDHELGDLVLQPEFVWTIRALDADGVPIGRAHASGVRRRSTSFDRRVLAADAEGLIVVPRSTFRSSSIRIGAEGFLSEGVELPPEPPSEPIEVQLDADTSLVVIARGPWDERVVQAGWEIKFELVGDRLISLQSLPRDGINWDELLELADTLKEAHLSRGGVLSTDRAGERKQDRLSSVSARPHWSAELLRPHHPLVLRVGLASVPEALGRCPDAWLFEQELWLEPSEERIIHADLSGWTGAR